MAKCLNRISSGTIAKGKLANLILLSKNPLENIQNIKTIEGVILKGKWLDRKAINLMLREVEGEMKK